MSQFSETETASNVEVEQSTLQVDECLDSQHIQNLQDINDESSSGRNEEQIKENAQEEKIQSQNENTDHNLVQKGQSSFGNDEIPIGSKSSFNISEFPDENTQVKKVIKKPSKFAKQSQQAQVEQVNEKPTEKEKQSPVQPQKENTMDELPVGVKGKFNVSEFPDDDNQAPKQIQSRKKGGKPAARNNTVMIKKDNEEQEKVEKPVHLLDEVPVGGGRRLEISEYPPGANPDEEEIDNSGAQALPLLTRLKSKVFKMRQSGFEEMIQIFEEDGCTKDKLADYYEDWAKYINDTNPASQEKALLAFKAFLQKCDKKQFQERVDGIELIKVLVDKCISPGKPQIRKISFDILCDLFERREKNDIYESLKQQINNKNTKITCAAIQCVIELLTNFGPKPLDFLKPFFGEIEKQCVSTNSSVRTDCMNFYKEAYKWLGKQVLEPFLKNLKKAQQEELEKYQAEVEQSFMQPLRGPAIQVNPLQQGQQNMDVYDIVDSVDIFAKYNDKWMEKLIALPKWNEKVSMLDELIKAANVPKISAPKSQSSLISFVKALLIEPNVNVNLGVIKLLGCLVKGIRKPFFGLGKLFFPLLLSKLRDKKPQIVDETKVPNNIINQLYQQTLDNFYYAIGIEDIVDDVKEGLNDKSAQMKVNVLSFLSKNAESRQLVQYNKQKYSDALKMVIPIVKKLLEDSVPEVREQSLLCLGRIKPFLPENLVSQLSDINTAKLQKVNEIAQTKKEEGQQQQKKQQNSLGDSQVKQEVQLQQNQKKPPIAQQQQKVQKIVLDEEVDEGNYETILKDKGLEDSFFKMMDGNIKDKVSALHELQNYDDILQSSFDVVLKYLRTKTKDWKESNLQLVKELFSLIHYVADMDPKPINKKSLPQLCRFLIEKMGESKFKDDISQIIETTCQCVSPSYVIVFLISQTAEDKKSEKKVVMPPKTIAEIIMQIVKIINLVSIKFVPVKELIDFAKENVIQTNVAVKQSTIELFKCLYQYIGQDILNFISDLPPQTLKSIQGEFEKVSVYSKDTIQKQSTTFQGCDSTSKEESNFQGGLLDNMPRADISSEIPRIMKKFSDIQWQKKKEGIEELDKLLTQNNNRIQMQGLGEVIAQLKQGLTEKTKSIIRSMVNIVGRLADACGKDFKNLGRQLVGPVISILSDKQVLVRQDAVVSLDKMANAMGSDIILQTIPQYLVLESPELRIELLNFILKNGDGFSKTDLKQYVSPLINCICDRSKDIRVLGEQVMERVIDSIGVEPFVLTMKDQKPALVQTIKQVLIKYGADLEENDKGQKGGRQNRTPKTKGMNSTQPMDGQKKLQRNQTQKDLNTSLDNSAHSNNLNTSGHHEKNRTPVKSSYGQKSTSKLLPSEITGQTPKLDSRGIKAVFLESSLIATSMSIRDLKGMRLNQSDSSSNWGQETFVDTSVQETIQDLRLCLKPGILLNSIYNLFQELSQILLSYDYKQVIQALKILSGICNDAVQKINIVEISDLLIKWLLINLYGGCKNLMLLQSMNSFYGVLLNALERTGYILNDLEMFLCVRILREIIYQQTKPDDRIFNSLLKVGGPEKVIKNFIKLIQLDPVKIHCFLSNDQLKFNVEREVFRIIQVHMINFLSQDNLNELAKMPELQRQPEFIQELQRNYGDQAVRRAGINSDPTTIASSKINQRIQSQQQNTVVLPQQQRNSNMQIKQVSESQVQQIQQPTSPRTLNFKNCLNSLLSQQVATKIESLMQINDLISQCDNQQNESYPLYLFLSQAQIICTCFHSLMTWSFMASESVPPQYKQFLLQALQKLYQLQPYVRSLPYEPLCQFTEDLMLRLLIEDEHKVQVEQGDQIVKQLNSTTLRILENCDPDIVYCILLDLLIKYRRKQQQQGQPQQQSKIISLLVKCIIRVTKMLEKCINQINVEMLVLKFHNYMAEFSTQQNFPIDDVGMKTIKTILSELVKLMGEGIWESYNIVQQSDVPDQHISQWIKMLLMTSQGAPAGVVSAQQMISPRERFERRIGSQQGGNFQAPPNNKQQIYNSQSLSYQQQQQLLQNENNQSGYEMKQDTLKRPQQYQSQIPPSNNTHELEQKLNSLKMRVSMGQVEDTSSLMRSNNYDQQNQQSNQGPQLKTPDYLMQRLNDMKNKVQSLVGTQPPLTKSNK